MVALTDRMQFDGVQSPASLQELAGFLASLAERAQITLSISVNVNVNGVAGVPARPLRARLTPQQKKILEVLAGQPAKKAAWIALRIGKRGPDGHLRSTLADMVAAGVLVKGSDGYGYQLAAPVNSRPIASSISSEPSP
jgi:hypothetical protein